MPTHSPLRRNTSHRSPFRAFHLALALVPSRNRTFNTEPSLGGGAPVLVRLGHGSLVTVSDRAAAKLTMKPYRGPPAMLGSTAAAGARIIVWCRDCRHQVEPDPAEMAVPYGAGTSETHWPLTNPLEGRRAETHDSAPWKASIAGISLWKGQYDAFVAPLTLAPYSKNGIRGTCSGGSHEADRLAFHDNPLVRGGVQPGSVGWDCRCGAPLGGVRSRGHQRPIWLYRLEGEGHREGAALIVTASCHLTCPQSGSAAIWSRPLTRADEARLAQERQSEALAAATAEYRRPSPHATGDKLTVSGEVNRMIAAAINDNPERFWHGPDA